MRCLQHRAECALRIAGHVVHRGLQRVDRDPACHVPRRVTAHAVRNSHEERVLTELGHERRIFVARAHITELAAVGNLHVAASSAVAVVGRGDSRNHGRVVEAFRTRDLRHEPDQHAIAQNLRLQSGRAVGVPHRFAAIGYDDSHPGLENTGACEMRHHALVAERADDATCSVFLHAPSLPGEPGASRKTCVDTRRTPYRACRCGLGTSMRRALALALEAVIALTAAGASAAPPEFTRVQSGPVLTPTRGFYDDYMVASPSV